MPESSPEFDRELRTVLATLQLRLTTHQISQLQVHYGLLKKWNRHVNLTGIKQPREIVERHFGESLFLAQRLGLTSGSLIDVGSGAGFPGVPIAVFSPSVKVTLVESVAKKVAFLKEIARTLTNVTVVHGRLEEVSGWFDWATLRAVSPAGVVDQLAGLVGKVAILTVGTIAERLADTRSGFTWQAPESLPWGRHGALLIGIRTSGQADR